LCSARTRTTAHSGSSTSASRTAGCERVICKGCSPPGFSVPTLISTLRVIY
jgi:hypothetical protein